MLLFYAYTALFLIMAAYDARRCKSTGAFFLNNRTSGTVQTSFSLIASCVGGSATIGMCGLAYQVGLPAIWWLASGAVGLSVLTFFLAARVRRSQALTMPELVKNYVGERAYRLIVVVIFIAWLAILAAQFSAMARVVASLTQWGGFWPLMFSVLFILLYTLLGGQASVIRSDVVQYVILSAGLLLLLFQLLSQNPDALNQMPWELLNADFGWDRWTYFMLLMGGSYVVCPMLFARFLSARDEKIAVRSGYWAVFGLLATSLVIVLIGIAASPVLGQGVAADQVLTDLIAQTTPGVRVIILLALMSAILSSADSCLITAATVLSNDALKRPNLPVTRACILLVTLAGTALALVGKDILGLLLMANNIYVCGVVVPVFVVMMSSRQANRPLLIGAIAGGGALGLAAEIFAENLFSYLGFSLALILSLIALLKGNNSNA